MKISEFKPAKGKVFVTNMDEGVHKTAGGIILPDDNVKEAGIRPRWSQVAYIGEDADVDLEVGEWVLVEHGRWTNRITLEFDDHEQDIWMIDTTAILVVSDRNHSESQITF